MEIATVALSVIVTVVGALSAIAYRGRRWSMFFEYAWRGLLCAFAGFGFLAIGLELGRRLPKEVAPLAAACAAISGTAIFLAICLTLADWLREPEAEPSRRGGAEGGDGGE